MTRNAFMNGDIFDGDEPQDRDYLAQNADIFDGEHRAGGSG